MAHKLNKNKIKNKQRIAKAWNASLNIILWKISQTDITHTQLSCIPPTKTCRHFVQVLVNHRWLCHAKNRSQHWENSRLDCSRFRHMPRSPVNYFMLVWFSFVQKRLFKILFKCENKKSDDKVHQSRLSKRRPSSVQSALLYPAVLWPMCFARTAYNHSL